MRRERHMRVNGAAEVEERGGTEEEGRASPELCCMMSD